MKLLTQNILKKMPALYSTDGEKQKQVIAKFFTPDANWTWYAFEGEQQGDDFLFFGLVDGLEKELGNFSLNERKSARGAFGLPVERDRHFEGVYNIETNEIERS